LGNLFLPNAGQEKVLSDEVQQMLRLLRENDVTDYRLSPEFASDMKIQQRVTEAAWPIRPQDTSNYLLGSLEQIQNDPACTIIDTEKDVALANCQ
jgi:hypothetical protein